MSTLLVSLSSLQLVEIEVRAGESEWEGFTHINVVRSQAGQDGPYDNISGNWWSAAVVPEGSGPPAVVTGRTINIVGRMLEVVVDQTQTIPVTFTGTDPLDYEECCLQINTAGDPYITSWVTAEGKLVISSRKAGGISSISVAGDAAPLLELPSNEVIFGLDPHPVLHRGRDVYKFKDYYGNRSFWYRTRFINTSSGAVSEFSPPVRGGSRDDLPTSSIAVGYLKLIDPQGRAQKNVRAIISVDPQTASISGRLVTGAPIEKLADENGYVEFELVKGLKVTLIVPDMGIVRKVTVPDTSSFSLIDAGIGEDDPYEVKRISISYGERRNF
jgi:hypothetical protein